MKEDTAFIPRLQWAKKKGEYPTYMMFSYFGVPEEVLLRENVRIYDHDSNHIMGHNMQLEVASFPGGPALGEKQLMLALDAIQAFHDRNRGRDHQY